MIDLNFQELFRTTAQCLRTKHCIMLDNPSQSASFSCTIIILSSTPKKPLQIQLSFRQVSMNSTFLHFCALHCPYSLHLPLSISCTSALCYTIVKHHCASLPESAWLQQPWQINAFPQSSSLLLQQSSSPEKAYLFLPLCCLKYTRTWKEINFNTKTWLFFISSILLPFWSSQERLPFSLNVIQIQKEETKRFIQEPGKFQHSKVQTGIYCHPGTLKLCTNCLNILHLYNTVLHILLEQKIPYSTRRALRPQEQRKFI